MNVLDTVHTLSRSLKQHGVDFPEQEAGMLVRHVLDITTLEMYRDNQELTKDQISALQEMLGRRINREPLQYITAPVSFLELKLLVGPGVLIPRPETEFMAAYAIETVKKYRLHGMNETNSPLPATRYSPLNMLDLCTGCGCLALSLAHAFPDAAVYGTDVSAAALGYAQRNAETNGISNTGFLLCDVKEMALHHGLPADVDLVISNPPYVRTGDIRELQPEIRDWEPRIALDGGQDGFDLYREIVPEAGRFLRQGGLIMLEVGAGQARDVADICTAAGFTRIEVLRDLSGIERIVQARWKK